MKRFMAFFLVFIFLGMPFSGHSKPQPESSVIVHKLSPRTIVLSNDGPMDNNIIALHSQKGIVIIDTHISPSVSLSIREKIEEVFACEDFRYVIYTHSHGDHTWGSQVFPEATFIAHENCLDEMAGIQEEVSGDIQRTQAYIDHLENQTKNMKSSSQDYEEKKNTAAFYKTILEGWVKDFAPALPNIAFTDRLKLDLGDIRLLLIHFPGAHSNSDILIHCPEEDLLSTGDLFVPRMNPSFLKTDTIPRIFAWISALEQVMPEKGAPSHVIPGHGDFLTSKDMEVISQYFRNQLSFTQGKKSAFPIFKKILEESGTPAALEKLQEMALSKEYFLLENDLSSQGYLWLYREKKTAEAIAIFKIMTEIFPDSWNAWDCLAEGYMANDDVDQAIRFYQKSLSLNPDNSNGLAMLKRLREKE
jgi:glyoxylase-like metal-dependent hydrolase (beta-lactamase superfamily II)